VAFLESDFAFENDEHEVTRISLVVHHLVGFKCEESTVFKNDFSGAWAVAFEEAKLLT